MNWFRKNPLFGVSMTVCVVVALAELALTYERYAAWRGAEKKLEQRKMELQGMAELTPPPKRDVAQAIEADLAKAKAALASMQSELKGHGPTAERVRAAKAPGARTDAFFDLATYVERMRDVARKQGVDVRPEAVRFGFAAYAKEGPETERIEPVFRQRQVAQYLVESLLEAKPQALLAVKREHTHTKAERDARAAALANGEQPQDTDLPEGPDYFLVGREVTARVPNYIDTIGFRFVFIGQTAALRSFLNRLATFDLPVLVRDIEVDTATAEELAAATEEAAPAQAEEPTQPAAASVVLTEGAPEPKSTTQKAAAPRPVRPPAAVPIVSKSVSKYTVTVEYIELVTPTNPEGAPPPNS